MKPERLLKYAVIPALELLPDKMTSKNALMLMMAIATQESDCSYRRQIGGPARGYWQFEIGGVQGVLSHHATKDYATYILSELDYPLLSIDTVGCHYTLEHNDILAAAFARLLLWTVPDPLPVFEDSDAAWKYYISSWRPGKPHPDKWSVCCAAAKAAVASL